MLSKIKKFFLGNGAVILAGVLAVVFALNTLQAIVRNWQFQREINRLGSEVALLRAENERLAYDIAYYKTDQYLELAARQKLNLKAPGEQVAVISHNTPQESNPGTADNTLSSLKHTSNWRAWWNFLNGENE